MTNRAIVVTGANGFVGRALCDAAVSQGFHVKGATRSACHSDSGVENVIVGAVDGVTDWTAALNGMDVVIHLAARVHVMCDNADDPLAEFHRVNTIGTEHLARSAAASGVKRIVYVSSIKVNGEETSGGRIYSELDAPAPQDPYGISKWDAEQALHRVANETGLEVVIVRPPLVYGAGVKGNFIQMLKVLGKGVPLPLASANNRRSLVYLENLVDALVLCASHPAAAGQTYLISDGEDISISGLLRHLALAMNVPLRLFPCPAALLKLGGIMLGKSDQVERLLGSLQIDSSKIRRELNWQPAYTLSQGLQKTVEWYRSLNDRERAKQASKNAV